MIFLRINLTNFVQAYRYDSSRERSDGMIFTRPRKCRYGTPSHTTPLRALCLNMLCWQVNDHTGIFVNQRTELYLNSRINSLHSRYVTSLRAISLMYIVYAATAWSSSDNFSYNLSALHTHKHPFNGPFSGTTQVSRYQKGKTNLDFTEARDSEWQWHQLGHMQLCTSLQTDNHTSTSPLSFFTDALPAAQPTASKH